MRRDTNKKAIKRLEIKEQKTENGKNVEKIDSGQSFRAKNFGYS